MPIYQVKIVLEVEADTAKEARAHATTRTIPTKEDLQNDAELRKITNTPAVRAWRYISTYKLGPEEGVYAKSKRDRLHRSSRQTEGDAKSATDNSPGQTD